MDNSTCVILVPVSTHVEPECEERLDLLEKRGYEVWRLIGRGGVDHSRSLLATMALAKGFKELFWIDADVIFDPEDVDRFRSHNLPIVGGIYAQRVAAGGIASFWTEGFHKEKQFVVGKGGGLMETLYTGTGFLYTKAEVYPKIQKHWDLPECNRKLGAPLVPYFMPFWIELEGEYRCLVDDYSFCERARQAGYKIMVDTTIRLWHLGKYRYGWEDTQIAMRRLESFQLPT